jgi:hypothetical protein
MKSRVKMKSSYPTVLDGSLQAKIRIPKTIKSKPKSNCPVAGMKLL